MNRVRKPQARGHKLQAVSEDLRTTQPAGRSTGDSLMRRTVQRAADYRTAGPDRFKPTTGREAGKRRPETGNRVQSGLAGYHGPVRHIRADDHGHAAGDGTAGAGPESPAGYPDQPLGSPVRARCWQCSVSPSRQELLLVLAGQFIFGVHYLARAARGAPGNGRARALGFRLRPADRGSGSMPEQVSLWALVSMFGFSALGGAWWPLDITGHTFSFIGHLLPSAWAMDAFFRICSSEARESLRC